MSSSSSSPLVSPNIPIDGDPDPNEEEEKEEEKKKEVPEKETTQLRYLQSLVEIEDSLHQHGTTGATGEHATTNATTTTKTITRVGNINVIRKQQQDEQQQEDIVAHCRLLYFVGLTTMVESPRYPQIPIRVPTNIVLGVEGAAAVALAAQHLNTGNGSIIPQVHELNQRCPIQFDVKAIDTMWSQQIAVNQIIESTTSTTSTASSTSSSSSASSTTSLQQQLEQPCTILGAGISRVSMSTAMITGLRNYLQLSFSSATELDNRDLFPLSGRVRPSLKDAVIITIRYIHEILHVTHLAVLHTDTRESQSYSIALQQAQIKYAPTLQLISIDIPDNWDTNNNDDTNTTTISEAVLKSKQTQYTYFLAAIKAEHFDDLWDEAVKQEIAGTGIHNWILPGVVATTERTIYNRNTSSHAKAVLGQHMISVSGYINQLPNYDKFLVAMEELSNSPKDKNYIQNHILPTYTDIIQRNGTNPFQSIIQHPNFLKTASTTTKSVPRGFMTWAYDSAIAAGLAACDAISITISTTTGNGNETMPYLDGKTQFEALTRTTFDGTTGNITFDPITGTRQNAFYQIINVQIDKERSNETHVGFKHVTTGMFVNGQFTTATTTTAWGENNTTYPQSIFNDGTTNIPPDLMPIQLEKNQLSTELRAVGLTMCAVIVILAVSASIWVQIHVRARVVRSSQPIFLHLLCFGVAMIGLSIIPLSIDEGVSETSHRCDVACLSFPWLLSVGFSLTFSALWAKTARANKIIQNPSFRRMTVSAFDVAKPMLVFLLANAVILSLWTALSPMSCETEVLVLDSFNRPIETRGYCGSSLDEEHNSSLGYLIALGVINLGPLAFAVYEAYVARHISTEYAETDYILKALIVILLVCFIGIPVIIIASDNSAAYFFILSAIILVVCMSILLLMVGPKILAHYNIQLCGENKQTVPSRFSRRFSTTNLQNKESSSQSSSVDGLLVSGLVILSHPKTQEALKEDNEALRSEVEELKQALLKLQFKEEEETKSQQPIQQPLSDGDLFPPQQQQRAFQQLQEESGEALKRNMVTFASPAATSEDNNDIARQVHPPPEGDDLLLEQEDCKKRIVRMESDDTDQEVIVA